MKGLYRARDRVFRPWKNGGGQTAGILACPEGAGFDEFDWRLSTAVVASDGPFSVFPGVDRVLVVIEGGPMVLTTQGQDHRLGPDSAPFAFAGDLPCEARLDGAAPLLDFNVMVRRPLCARVDRGPFAPLPADGARVRLALLLAERAGLSRLDLVDLDAADPALVGALAGVAAVTVTVTVTIVG